MRRLVLLDIDGTLLTSRLGRAALNRAFSSRYGWEDACAGISFGGRTDPWIVEAVFTKHGRSAEDARAEQGAAIAAYLGELEAEIARLGAEAATALPGAGALIEALAEDERVLLGVLTGNVEGGARAKLLAAGLGDGFYEVSAFGDDADTRRGLLPVALERADALERGAPWRASEVVIVGDTPRDVDVARAHGARAVAISTGTASPDELERLEPDALLSSLLPLERSLAAILA